MKIPTGVHDGTRVSGARPTQFAPSSLRAVCDAGPPPGSRMRAKRKNSIPVENRFIVHPSERGYKTLSVKVADSIATDAPKNRTGPARSGGRDWRGIAGD